MHIQCKAPVRVDFAGAWTDVKFFADAFGGATVNAGINHYVTGQTRSGAHAPGEGICVNYETEIPAGSGLGTSSALNVAWLSLARGHQPRNREERGQIAEQAYQVETVLGILGGKQDQYAAAFGGFHLYEFEADKVRAIPINITRESAGELNSLLTLCYTGQARLSSNLHSNVWNAFRAGNPAVVQSLFALREAAYRARDILECADWDAFGPLLQHQQNCASQLDASISNARIAEIFQLVAPHTMGGKCCGAGGGGCILFASPDSKSQQLAAQKLRAHDIRVIDFQWDFDGLTLTQY